MCHSIPANMIVLLRISSFNFVFGENPISVFITEHFKLTVPEGSNELYRAIHTINFIMEFRAICSACSVYCHGDIAEW